MKKQERIRLDNAANIYPFAANRKWNNIHRITAVLTSEVKPNALQEALEKTLPRFPNFNVLLKKDFFWNYFVKADKKPEICEEVELCKPFNLKNNLLFRILYTSNSISIETFHALADGYGALAFLNCLLTIYFELNEEKIDYTNLAVKPYENIDSEEIEDSFQRYADLKGGNKRREEDAYQIDGTAIDGLKRVVVNLDINTLKKQVKESGYKLTEFLLAIFFDSLIKTKRANNNHSKAPVKISLAINLRQFFPSKTLRNFSTFINLKVENKDYTIDELVKVLQKQMTKVNKEYCKRNFNENVKAEKAFIIHIMPRFIKKAFLSYMYNHTGEKQYSSVLSNLGVVNAPSQFSELVDHYECMIGRQKVNNTTLCCVTYNNTFSFTFSRKIEEHQVEDFFVENLKKYNII